MSALAFPTRPALAATQLIGGPAFGSSWRATLPDTRDAEAIVQMIEVVIAEVDACFSPYRKDSALSRFNASLTTSPQVVDPALGQVAATALEIAGMTNGYFDPTVGPLVARQGFGPIAGGAVTFRAIEPDGNRLRKASPDATLDLCGIAKGHALDRIVDALQDVGLTSAIVDVGGEIKAIGSHPESRAWSVGIVDPARPGAVQRVVTPDGMALATSGHAANGVRGRVQTSHIIDPHRRSPAAQSLLSVSVLHSSATWADALATALCAAGPEAGPDLAEHLNIRSLFIFETAERAIGGVGKHILI